MLAKEILATVHLAHHFQSAFSVEQVYRFLRVPAMREQFDQALQELLRSGQVEKKSGMLLAGNYYQSYRQRRQWSRNHFRKHRWALKLLVYFPWVRYVAMTGANAFESCAEEDDIDLFVITQKDRLWLCYLALVMFSKLIGKRPLFCLNYLIDETHMQITPRDYYTAVQIVQLLPLLDSSWGRRFLEANEWICDHLPNAGLTIPADRSYLLRLIPERHTVSGHSLLRWLNSRVYSLYRRRLTRLFPEAMDKGISIGPGYAKLNRMDHHDIYQIVYAKIDKELAAQVVA